MLFMLDLDMNYDIMPNVWKTSMLILFIILLNTNIYIYICIYYELERSENSVGP